MTWLSGWKKRRKLTIDGFYVDSILNNFPVLVNLSTSAGINNDDVSDIIEYLNSNISVNDDFTGPDNSYVDSDKWVTSESVNGTVKILNNELHISLNSSASSEYSVVYSLFNLHGDFDIQIDFNDLNIDSSVDGCGVELKIAEGNGDQSQYRSIIKAGQYSSSDRFKSLIKIAGTETANYHSRLYSYGKIRLVRSDTVLTTYYIDGSDTTWQQLGSESGFMTADCRVYLGVWSPTNGGAVGADIDNFTVVSGVINWPIYGTYPNRKKVMFTKNDGVTPLYAEIDKWDYVGKDVRFWVNVPTVLSGINTDIYFYYDPDQYDNNHYIGDTGNLAAKKVWDSNFKAVYHMSQDPSTGGACILDSTSNANHGTPYGNMTSDDLIDGVFGKGIQFDEDGNYILIPDEVWNNTLSTVEILAKFYESAGNGYIFCKGASGESVSTNQLRIDWRSSAIFYHFERGGGTNYNYGNYTLPYNPRDGSYHVLTAIIKPSKFSAAIDGEFIQEVSTNGNTDTTAPTALGPTNNTNGVETYSHFRGIVNSVRVSNISRSEAWIKATYYSNTNNLIFWDSEKSEPIYYIDGYIKENNIPVSRIVRIYDRTTGLLIDTNTSRSSDGYYYVTTTYSGEHFVVVFDDNSGDVYNALISDRLIPRAI